MRKIKQVFRLLWLCGLSRRETAKAVQIGRATIGEYVRRAEQAGLAEWKAVQDLDEGDLERQLFPTTRLATVPYPVPDWKQIHQELVQDKHVTRSLLWEEYRQDFPDGYSYSRFCELYAEWSQQLNVCMRQEHRAGEKLFVDYCGRTVEIVDRRTGEIREAQIFVAVLGASNYTFAEATWSQQLPDWIGSHRRAFEFLGGSAEITVPDNLKSGVHKPCWYEPEINPTYWEMAEHYGTAILPARVRKPRDKAKVEAGVLMVERWILACLRHRTFFSLSELNREIARLLERLNDKPLRVLGLSRRELFESLDLPALQPLPEQPYEYAEWKTVKPGIDYHVEVDGHYYSVPYQLVGKKLDVRATRRTVEVFRKGKRVSAHARDHAPGRHSTVSEHMPKAHQGYLEWTPKRLIRWAEKSGPRTREVVETILESRPHPQQGFRSCLGIMRLGERHGTERLEAAAGRALEIRSPSYKSIKSILRNGLDRQKSLDVAPTADVDHENVRGAGYYR